MSDASARYHTPATPELLDGWASLVLWRVSPNTDAMETAVTIAERYHDRWTLRLRTGTTSQTVDRIFLDLRRPECAHRVVDVSRAGVRCTECRGSRMAPITVDPTGPCGACDATGYLRAPHELRDLLPVTLGGKVTPIGAMDAAEVSAALLAESWRGILAGVGPVRGLVGPGEYLPLSKVTPWRLLFGLPFNDEDCVRGICDTTTTPEDFAARGYAVRTFDGALVLPNLGGTHA